MFVVHIHVSYVCIIFKYPHSSHPEVHLKCDNSNGVIIYAYAYVVIVTSFVGVFVVSKIESDFVSPWSLYCALEC